jgi:hypothetical protein
MGKGVKHYKKDGTVWNGSYHKMPDGSLHTNKTHTKTSIKLYHYGDLTEAAKKKARSQRATTKLAPGGVATRNYRQEYDRYQGKPEQIKNRASRNAARATLKKAGVNVAGKDVAHRNGNAKDNRRSNLTTKTASQNRSYARTRTARKRNPYA